MSKRTDSSSDLDKAKKDYGTPAERAQRSADARTQKGDARAQAAESGSGRRKRQ